VSTGPDGAKPADAGKRGQIHDLGYKRYVGTRLAQSTRWRVIMRQQISDAWKKWWRYKLALGGAVLTMCIAGGLLYFGTEAGRTFRGFGKGGQVALTFTDGIVPLSMSFFYRMAFVLSLTLGAAIIASDTQSGAFTFYYVRSVRPRDYVIGKVAGYGLLVATLVVAGPLLLAGFRLGLADNTEQLVGYLIIVPKVLLIGALATLAYTTIPLAISALVPNRRYALAMWAAYYLIVGSIATAIGALSSNPAAALDLQTALQALTFELFDVKILYGQHPNHLDGTTAGIALAIQCAIAVGIIWYQVSRDQRAGVGGSS
jgi:hypothetical protein